MGPEDSLSKEVVVASYFSNSCLKHNKPFCARGHEEYSSECDDCRKLISTDINEVPTDINEVPNSLHLRSNGTLCKKEKSIPIPFWDLVLFYDIRWKDYLLQIAAQEQVAPKALVQVEAHEKVDTNSSSEQFQKSEMLKVPAAVEQSVARSGPIQVVVKQDYWKLKAADKRWVSEALFTPGGHKYSLIVRPNGLKYAKGYGSCVGIWLNPLRGDKDETLTWPARVRMSLRVLSGGLSDYTNLTIPMKEYTWKKYETKFRYPAFNFDLTAIKHEAVESSESKCLTDQRITLLVYY